MTLLLANLLVATYLTGVIWVVQLVHYPLFAQVGEPQWRAYEASHRVRITWVVAGPMLAGVGLAAAVALVGDGPAGLRWVNLALAVAPFAATFAVFVGLHDVLSARWDAAAHRRLVRGNWVRTVAWTAQAAVAAWLVLAVA
jgi:hypothetical protein